VVRIFPGSITPIDRNGGAICESLLAKPGQLKAKAKTISEPISAPFNGSMKNVENEERGALLLQLKKRRRAIGWNFSAAFCICVIPCAVLYFQNGSTIKIRSLALFFVAGAIFLVLNILFVDNAAFTQIDLYKKGVLFTGVFGRKQWVPISEIRELRAWNNWGKHVRPTLNFLFNDSKRKALAIRHEFRDAQIKPILQYLHDNDVPVYTHYLIK
jgi:hypothetical protein